MAGVESGSLCMTLTDHSNPEREFGEIGGGWQPADLVFETVVVKQCQRGSNGFLSVKSITFSSLGLEDYVHRLAVSLKLWGKCGWCRSW